MAENRSLSSAFFSAELSSAASKYYHKFDNSNGSTLTRLAKNRFLVSMPVRRVGQALFFQRMERAFGPIRTFWTLATSYLQILTFHYNLVISQSYIDQEKLILFKPGLRSESNLRNRVAQELGSIRNVVKIYLGLLAAEHECRFAAAFDFAWWQSQFSDERLSGPHAFRVTFSSRLQPPVLPAFLIAAFTKTSKTQPTGCLESTTDSIFLFP